VPTFTEITHDILTGRHDDEIDRIALAVNERRKRIRRQTAARNMAVLQVGDAVRIIGGRPQYIQGLTGKIVEKRQSKLIVQLHDGPIGKFRSGKIVCHAELLERM